jgi:hypothetical protein
VRIVELICPLTANGFEISIGSIDCGFAGRLDLAGELGGDFDQLVAGNGPFKLGQVSV